MVFVDVFGFLYAFKTGVAFDVALNKPLGRRLADHFQQHHCFLLWRAGIQAMKVSPLCIKMISTPRGRALQALPMPG